MSLKILISHSFSLFEYLIPLFYVRYRFHTDQAAVNTGFRLEWYNEGCGGKLTHPSGSLTSPNYPRRYTNEITCIWEIEVEVYCT